MILKRWPAILATCALAAQFSLAGDLPEESRTRALAATALVLETGSNEEQDLCAAVLVRKSGGFGYFVTRASWGIPASKLTLYLYPGSASPQALAVKTLTLSLEGNLSCLKVESSSLPEPLEVSGGKDLAEGVEAFVCGFKDGSTKADAHKDPKVFGAAVWRVRREKDLVTLLVLQSKSPVTQNGGAVVDARGRIIGLTDARNDTDDHATLGPAHLIEDLMKGRLDDCRAHTFSADDKAAKVEVTVLLCDPVGNVKSMGFSWIRRSRLTAWPIAEKDGSWKPAAVGMKDVPLKIDADDPGKISAVVEIPRAAGDPDELEIAGQAHCTLADGTTVWLAPLCERIRFKPIDLPATKPKPGVAVPPPGPLLSLPETLVEAARSPLRSVVGEIFLSKDGKSLFVLDLSEGALLRLSAETLAEEARAELPEAPVCACADEKGESVYVACLRMGSSLEKPASRIYALSSATLKLGDSVDVETYPSGIAATNSGLVLVCGYGLFVADMKKKTVVSVGPTRNTSAVTVHPGQERAYWSTQGETIGCLTFKSTPGKPFPSATKEAPAGAAGDCVLTPDSRFLMTLGGPVVRFSKDQPTNDWTLTVTLPRWTAVAMAPGCGNVFIATLEAGTLEDRSIGTFELRKALKLDRVCTRMLLDWPRKRLIAHVAAKTGPAGNFRSSQLTMRTYAAGDLVAWPLEGGK